MRRNVTSKYAILVLGLAFVGCGQTVQIVRAPFISPMVVPVAPEPHSFLMNVAVKNYNTTSTAQDLWLKIYSEYWPTASPQPGRPPCSQTDWLHVGALGPDKGWAVADYRIDRASNCRCVKDACVGHLWLDLHVAQGYAPHIPGTNTALHVNWDPSGDLAKLTVSEF
jgi:hypothetical protein